VSTGTIHDLGYKRYIGTRRPQSTRWRVIVRNQLRMAWKTWWRYKAPLATAVAATVIVGAFIYIARATSVASHGGFGIIGNVLDGLIPWSFALLTPIGFLVGLTVGAGAIAHDSQVGAFTFYFSRPVRPIDYVLGKLGGLFLLELFVVGLPPVVLAIFRAGMAKDTADLLHALPLIGKAALTGAAAALIFSAVPLGLSSLVGRRRNAIALWAVYYILVGSIFAALGATVSPALGTLDLPTAIEAMGSHLFSVKLPFVRATTAPWGWALASILVQSTVAIVIAWVRVADRSGTGVGGG
jgi:ABC-2 type transport system permease protein